MLKGFQIAILIVCLQTGTGVVMPPQNAQAAVHVAVDTNAVIQSNFLGVGAVYHGFAICPRTTVYYT
jgi:hypothetical protein